MTQVKVCPTCFGQGKVVCEKVCLKVLKDKSFCVNCPLTDNRLVECPTCEGRGYVMTSRKEV